MSRRNFAKIAGARPRVMRRSGVIGVGRAGVRSPSLQTGRADLPHPAFQSVGSLSRRSALFARSPRLSVRRSVPAKSIALDGFHHRLALAGTRVGLSSGILSFIRPPSCVPSLHGHYPLRRYYERSDSVPGGSSAHGFELELRLSQRGLPAYCIRLSDHSVSNHRRGDGRSRGISPGRSAIARGFCPPRQASPFLRRLAHRRRPNRVHVARHDRRSLLRTGRSRSVAPHLVLPRRSYGSIPLDSSSHGSELSSL